MKAKIIKIILKLKFLGTGIQVYGLEESFYYSIYIRYRRVCFHEYHFYDDGSVVYRNKNMKLGNAKEIRSFKYLLKHVVKLK